MTTELGCAGDNEPNGGVGDRKRQQRLAANDDGRLPDKRHGRDGVGNRKDSTAPWKKKKIHPTVDPLDGMILGCLSLVKRKR